MGVLSVITTPSGQPGSNDSMKPFALACAHISCAHPLVYRVPSLNDGSSDGSGISFILVQSVTDNCGSFGNVCNYGHADQSLYIYIYIYIERERESDTDKGDIKPKRLSESVRFCRNRICTQTLSLVLISVRVCCILNQSSEICKSYILFITDATLSIVMQNTMFYLRIIF
jgi:hypothetical protein